jgi:hydrogenase maturation protease
MLCGSILVSAEPVGNEIFNVCVTIRNETPFEHSTSSSRDEVLPRSLVSTHTLLGVQDGKFVSLVDPPAALQGLAGRCHNVGTWPVLVGEQGERDTMLSSPIILYDHPQIAPESSGDLFDGTEIDEILSLRIMTLTDEEKREMRHSDERARQILERTETLPAEQLMKLHGSLRGLHPLKEETP